MEYVYGTSVIGGVERENLKIVGGPALRGRIPDHSAGVRRQQHHRPLPHRPALSQRHGRGRDAVRLLYHQRALQVCGKDKVDGRNEKGNGDRLCDAGGEWKHRRCDCGEHKSLFETWQTGVAYTVGQLRNWGNKLYKCVQAHTSQAGWEPDKAASLWSAASDPAEEWPEWSKPVGAHDAYAKGDKVSHNGKHWTSTADANVWEPGVYGWTEATA